MTDIAKIFTNTREKVSASKLSQREADIMDRCERDIAERIAFEEYGITDTQELDALIEDMDITDEVQKVSEPSFTLTHLIAEYAAAWNTLGDAYGHG